MFLVTCSFIMLLEAINDIIAVIPTHATIMCKQWLSLVWLAQHKSATFTPGTSLSPTFITKLFFLNVKCFLFSVFLEVYSQRFSFWGFVYLETEISRLSSVVKAQTCWIYNRRTLQIFYDLELWQLCHQHFYMYSAVGSFADPQSVMWLAC